MLAANGRIKQDLVYVNGGEELHKEGRYYIEWHEGAKRRRKSVGIDAQHAVTQQKRKLADLNARNHGVSVVELEQSKNGKHRLTTAVTDYLAEIERHKKPRTHWSYRTTLEYFLESCTKPFVEDITREDLLAFCASLRDKHRQTSRTIATKFVYVISFLYIRA